MTRALLAAAALAGCGPKYDPKGPGPAPDPIGDPAPATATRVPPRPAAPPPPPPVEEEPPPPAADASPPHATLELAPTRGSKVSARLALVQLDDETTVMGTVRGLAKNTTYVLTKHDHCAGGTADDDSRRSNPVIWGLAIKTGADGTATVDDSAKAIHLDGPMSIVGAYVVVSKTPGSPELACGRIVGP